MTKHYNKLFKNFKTNSAHTESTIKSPFFDALFYRNTVLVFSKICFGSRASKDKDKDKDKDVYFFLS
jgi:hypothetical protein